MLKLINFYVVGQQRLVCFDWGEDLMYQVYQPNVEVEFYVVGQGSRVCFD